MSETTSRPRGRPRKDPNLPALRKISLYLAEEEIDTMRQHGDGSVSAGVRRAARRIERERSPLKIVAP